MRILNIHVQNYRIHRDIRAEFDPTLTLIKGPNESGKSTLVEAIHRAFFLKSKGTGGIHEEMESNHGGTPEVSVEFEANGTKHTLNKVFGRKGTTTLAIQGAETLTGDAAEEALSRILSVEGSLSGAKAKKGLPTRWAHLWVRQGTGDHSPLQAASEAQDQLRSQLQSRAGRGLMVSHGDNRLIARFQELIDETYTSQGKIKKGSELQLLTEELEKAQIDYEQKRALTRELAQAATKFSESQDDQLRHKRAIEQFDIDLAKIENQLKEVATLRSELQAAQSKFADTERNFKELQDRDNEIRTTRKELEIAEKKLKPGTEQLAKIDTERARLKADHQTAQQSQEKANAENSRISNLLTSWEAHQRLTTIKQEIDQVGKQLDSAKHLQNQLKELAARQSKVSSFTHPRLTQLRKLNSLAENSKIRLESHALKLEVLHSTQLIAIKGIADEDIAAGQARILTETTEITVGKDTKLRLTPGNSENLEQARIDADSALRAFERELQNLNVLSLEDAEGRHQNFQQTTRELEKIESRLEELDPAKLETRLHQLEIDSNHHQSLRDRQKHLIPMNFSSDLETIDSEVVALRQQQQELAEILTEINGREKALREKRDQSDTRLGELKQETQELETEVTRLHAGHALLVEQSGDPKTLAARLNEKEQARDKAKAAVEHINNKLTKLGADQLEQDQKRLHQSHENSRKLLNQARESMAAARERLRSRGSSDPYKDMLEAQARIPQLESSLKQVQSTAETRRDILNRLKSAQARNAEALAAPLEQATTPYLTALFGSNTEIKFEWSEDGTHLEGLDIDRTATGNGYFTFENHSHGTREQIALAVRLAMAEVLAANHGGCLPIVLDDAFTHADKHRIEKLKSVLYQGTQNGLQVILLTCHPEHYTGLAPKEISLTR